MPEKLQPDLTGVPETMFWPLHNRAAEARRPDALLQDPESIRIADSLNYDFVRSFGKPDMGHVFRALAFDQPLRAWLEEHPDGRVVALGEGLETQMHRVDNGRVQWLSVDLPESIQLREKFIPTAGRHRNLPCSALDLRWMDELPAGLREIFVTAAGLLMYLPPAEVRRLISAIAERFPESEMIFDTIPRWISRKTLQGWKKTPHYTTPPMPFGINRDELQSIRLWHPNIAEVSELPLPHGRGKLGRIVLNLILRLPKLRYLLPTFVHLKFRPYSPA